MKIWIGLSFFATAVIGVSGGAWIGSLIHAEDSAVSVEPELMVEEKVEEVEPKQEISIESKPVEAPKVEPQPIVSNTPKTDTQPATNSKVSESTQKTEIKNTSESTPTVKPTYKYSNIHDFEKAYVGWCPKDVPEGEYHLPLRKYVTLGYIDSYVNYRDIDTAVIYAWTLLEGGIGGGIEIFLQEWTNLTQYTIHINHNTREVSWIYRGTAPQPNGPSPEVIEKLNTIIADFKSRMNQLDQRYYAKCGY